MRLVSDVNISVLCLVLCCLFLLHNWLNLIAFCFRMEALLGFLTSLTPFFFFFFLFFFNASK